MRFFTYQKLATAALVSVILLIFVGALVRVTGAGMGCPDWPTCWGKIIPPTSIEQVNFDTLQIERFQKKAENMGRDPSLITKESLQNEFNPRHVWTEFINRLCSLPVGFFTLATFIASFKYAGKRKSIFYLSFLSLVLVLTNAWMGARVVYSGISSNVLSTHLALAMALICVLTYCAWAGTERPKKLLLKGSSTAMWVCVLILFVCILLEGILGTQIREITDKLSKLHVNEPRETWIKEVEEHVVYFIHRSFSWVLLLAALLAFYLAKKQQSGGPSFAQYCVVAIMFTQMILGLIMAHVAIFPWTQLLHVGLTAILISLVFRWFLMIPCYSASSSEKKVSS